MDDNLKTAVLKIKEGFKTIEILWDINKDCKEILDSDECLNSYLFNESFDEVCEYMNTWCDSILYGIRMKQLSYQMMRMIEDSDLEKEYYPVVLKDVTEKINDKYGFKEGKDEKRVRNRENV